MLSYINDDANRVSHIQGLLMESGKTMQIVTSVLSVTEVAFAEIEQNNKLLDNAQEERISKLWEPGSPIWLIEFYELIAEDAKKLMRAGVPHGWSLRAADAIHLATADRVKAKEFHTYDSRLKKYSPFTQSKFAVVEPIANQAVILPEMTPSFD